jgi:hypothetical protein
MADQLKSEWADTQRRYREILDTHGVEAARSFLLADPLALEVTPDDGIAHHPDCDGWLMHVAKAREAGTLWFAACVIDGCGYRAPAVGCVGTARRAEEIGREHSKSERCDGRCNS